jgi:hypothetical protein
MRPSVRKGCQQISRVIAGCGTHERLSPTIGRCFSEVIVVWPRNGASADPEFDCLESRMLLSPDVLPDAYSPRFSFAACYLFEVDFRFSSFRRPSNPPFLPPFPLQGLWLPPAPTTSLPSLPAPRKRHHPVYPVIGPSRVLDDLFHTILSIPRHTASGPTTHSICLATNPTTGYRFVGEPRSIQQNEFLELPPSAFPLR